MKEAAMLDKFMQKARDAGVIVHDEITPWRQAYPDEPLDQTFIFSTAFAEDYMTSRNGTRWAEEWGWEIGPDDQLRVATEPIWRDYCIRRGLPLDTPYTVTLTGAWAGVEIDLGKTPRELRLVAPETYERDFYARVWLDFSRA